jgi:hypothetical protein
MTRYPNVHVRLRLAQHSSSNPPRDAELEIWLRGNRFHVRDPKHRRAAELIADATAPRGLGTPARTLEEMMDRYTESRTPPVEAPPTELYGDVATGVGWVYPSRGEPWETSAAKLAPVAEQILALDRDAGLEQTGTSSRLGRAATEYRGTVTVTEDGTAFRNDVVRVIAGPLLLLDDARNAGTGSLRYVREIIAIDEDTVTEADVTPPPR